MPYANTEKNKQYQREYQRLKRAGKTGSVKENLAFNLDQAQTAKGLTKLLAETILEVKESNADTIIKARLLGYLIGIGLKCVETADLEQRLTNLENALKDKKEV